MSGVVLVQPQLAANPPTIYYAKRQETNADAQRDDRKNHAQHPEVTFTQVPHHDGGHERGHRQDTEQWEQ